MYSKVEISGFRGADKIVLDKLGQINILVGKNNVGKSSCLEAVALLSSGSSGFRNAFNENSLKQVLGRRARDSSELKYLRHAAAVETWITGYRADGSGADNLVVDRSPHDIKPRAGADPAGQLQSERADPPDAENCVDPGLIGRLQSSMRSELKNDETVLDQMFFYFHGRTRALGVLYATENGPSGLAEPDQESEPAGSKSLFVNMRDLRDGLHDRLAYSQKLYDTIEKLHEVHTGITDIRQIGNALHVCRGDAAIPLHLTGDGFQASLVITAVTGMFERGVLVLEEPENSMHPGLVFNMMDELLSACKGGGVQIFISSHSDELVSSALEMQAGASVSVHHIGRFDNGAFVESFDLAEAKERRLDLQLDLRGL